MATVKVKLRKSTVSGKPGTIYYQLSHRRQTLQITTSIRLLPREWDAEAGKIQPNPVLQQPDLRAYSRQIGDDLKKVCQIIALADARQRKYTVRDIAEEFRTPNAYVRVPDFFLVQIELLVRNGKLGTARNYRRTLSSFMSFLGNADLPFSAFDQTLIEAYNRFLESRGVVRNTVSFYMRILRSVYNQAVRQQITEQKFPFEHVYTGVDRTSKRAVGEEVITRLRHLNLQDSPPLAFVRDLFIFSYCTRGMAFVDMAFLQKQNIHNGIIRYKRRKTGQQLAVRLEPCIREIVDRYTATTKHSDYIFPIINVSDPGTAYAQYQSALGYYNRMLKRLSEQLRLETGLSSYTPRHSWATAARNHNIPLAVISAGMGHASERTTQIYLASLENSVIDQANQAILASLNG